MRQRQTFWPCLPEGAAHPRHIAGWSHRWRRSWRCTGVGRRTAGSEGGRSNAPWQSGRAALHVHRRCRVHTTASQVVRAWKTRIVPQPGVERRRRRLLLPTTKRVRIPLLLLLLLLIGMHARCALGLSLGSSRVGRSAALCCQRAQRREVGHRLFASLAPRDPFFVIIHVAGYPKQDPDCLARF